MSLICIHICDLLIFILSHGYSIYALSKHVDYVQNKRWLNSRTSRTISGVAVLSINKHLQVTIDAAVLESLLKPVATRSRTFTPLCPVAAS